MARGDYPSAKQDQFMVRFPDGMRDRLKASAERRSRSMNSEIVARLESSYRGWPKITLDQERFARVQNATSDQRTMLENEIDAFVVSAVDRALPASHALQTDAMTAFERLLSGLDPEAGKELRDRHFELLAEIRKAPKRVRE